MSVQHLRCFNGWFSCELGFRFPLGCFPVEPQTVNTEFKSCTVLYRQYRLKPGLTQPTILSCRYTFCFETAVSVGHRGHSVLMKYTVTWVGQSLKMDLYRFTQRHWFGRGIGDPVWREHDGGWRKDEARPLVTVIALCSLHWIDTDGWVTGRTTGLWKTPVPLIPRGSLPEQVGEDTSRNWLTQVHLENGH